MASRLPLLMKTFGWKTGMAVYLRLKAKLLGGFYDEKNKIRFFIRPQSTDAGTFVQTFIHEQYKVALPFVPLTIIDGGANIGMAALYFHKKYADAHIVSIEPSKTNFEILQKNTEAIDQIFCLHTAIWNDNTHLEIIDTTVGEDAYRVAAIPAATANSIVAVSIESIMKQNSWEYIDILKLDIEGSEKEVFEKNYSYWLPRTKVIYVELHDFMRKGAAEAVFKAIASYNFTHTRHHENEVFFNNDLI